MSDDEDTRPLPSSEAAQLEQLPLEFRQAVSAALLRRRGTTLSEADLRVYVQWQDLADAVVGLLDEIDSKLQRLRAQGLAALPREAEYLTLRKEANALLDRNALLERKTTVERRLNMLAINGCLALLTEVVPISRKMLALVDEAIGGFGSAPTDSSQPRTATWAPPTS
jgi:hypothetical protein